jgi:hypothetical protein
MPKNTTERSDNEGKRNSDCMDIAFLILWPVVSLVAQTTFILTETCR